MQSQSLATIFTRRFTTWKADVKPLLEAADLAASIPAGQTVLVKPNLVNYQKPPVTTPASLVEPLVDYLLNFLPADRIIIGEGCGTLKMNTLELFEMHGYSRMASDRAIALIDLNEEDLVTVDNPGGLRWQTMFLPRIVMESFLISVPVLKAHSLAGVTLSMKNMMGLAPPSHYQQGGAWKKATFHDHIQESVFDLNCCRTADFTLMDATVGMPEAHLRGPTCDPPRNLLIAGYDPVAVDSYGTQLLERNWKDIGHIHMAHGRLGVAAPTKLIQVY